ncbi:hypothetical protein GH714_016189 [Hevea brasiliensis]|uniref:TLDc domain-containing protein n=1 Tax=Hevea brasiliensis TaxID=3981 RepID=A0A6A6NHT4_HEVBR|nr:hypothetical protein GH714_016126 [Hevea brasiliensis]KAF2324670.1 hypothetical protein GH714_016189 [Hevea brasiliensis]
MSEQRELENLAASTGALPMLQNSFSMLVDPQTNAVPLQSLQQVFCINYRNPECEAPNIPDSFLGLLDHLGASIVDLFFITEKGGVSWIEFLRGYLMCCGRMPASMALNALLRVFATNFTKARLPLKLVFESSDNDSLEVELPVGKFLTWALTTVPSLTDCFTQFVNTRLKNSVSSEQDKLERSTSSLGEIPPREACDIHLLTRGRAWAISLTLRSTISEEILKPCLPSGSDGTFENLLYRSSLHGRGLNRFWSNIEGYLGPLLFLVSATSGDVHEDSTSVRKWIIGALTQQGFENKDMFYGSSGSLYAISPIFHVFSPSGKDKKFVYSHLHPTSRAYEPHPKPVGIAFGGTIGNERICIDEDFARVTVRHHAVDKTYQPGSLFPSQGFLPVEALISEVEVWGLGGRTAKEVQTSFKRREELFIEQRRKVDLKTFASWEDSPEKMMMDMMSEPNAVRREDR